MLQYKDCHDSCEEADGNQIFRGHSNAAENLHEGEKFKTYRTDINDD